MQVVNKKKYVEPLDRWLSATVSYLAVVTVMVWGLLVGIVGSIALIVFLSIGLTFDAMMAVLFAITLIHWMLFGSVFYLVNRR